MDIVPNIWMRKIRPVGSQVTCDPPPPLEESDRDFLVLVWSKRWARRQLEREGWKIEGPRGLYGDILIGNNFFSARMLDHNLIVTNKRWFFNRFLDATLLAKELNLLQKTDRKSLFEYVLYKKHKSYKDK